jgi:tetrahydromethanopterin S-methyltransferase subunit G
MSREPDNLVLTLLREVRSRVDSVDRKLDKLDEHDRRFDALDKRLEDVAFNVRYAVGIGAVAEVKVREFALSVEADRRRDEGRIAAIEARLARVEAKLPG